MSGIGHNSRAVAQASYSDFRLVKTRSAAQIVLEIPIEEAGAFVDAFGLPIPGHEIHVAIARLQVPATDEEPSEARGEMDNGAPKVEHPNHPRNTAASERFRALGKPEQMVARAAMLRKAALFQDWLGVRDEEGARARIYDRCGIGSLSELAANEDAAFKWEQMLVEYDIWRGAIPERRG